MRTFKIVDHYEIHSWDVIYGISSHDGTWILFDQPVTVTSSPHPDDVIPAIMYGTACGRPYNVSINRGVTQVMLDVS